MTEPREARKDEPRGPFRDSPYYGIKKALTEAEQHTYVRCSLHNHDRDTLVEIRQHLAVIRELAEDIIPWTRDYAERVNKPGYRLPSEETK